MLRLLGYGLLLALVAGLLFTACISACGVAVVSVAAGDTHLVAPVPLLIPLLATRLAPDRTFHDEHRFDDDREFGRGSGWEHDREHDRKHDREQRRERRWRGEWGGDRDSRSGFRHLPREAVLGLRALSGVLDSLEGVENARLVEVRDGADRVLVGLEDGDLVVRVREGNSRSGGETGDRVEVRAPLEALRSVADACREDGRDGFADCDPRRLAWALLTSARGSEVRVEAEDARVAVTVW